MEWERLYQLMSDPDQCNPALSDALESVVRAYPYFHTARLLYTKSLSVTSDNRYREEFVKTALFCFDRRQLFYLIYQPQDTYGLQKAQSPQRVGVGRVLRGLERDLNVALRGEVVDS